MRMNKKKSSLALVLVMLLTVVVGVAWAADVDWGTPAAPSVFDYSNTYSTGVSGTTAGGATNYFNVTGALIPNADYDTAGEALAAATKGPNNDMSVGTIWGVAGDVFDANKLSVGNTGMTVNQGAIIFAGTPATFEKLAQGS